MESIVHTPTRLSRIIWTWWLSDANSRLKSSRTLWTKGVCNFWSLSYQMVNRSIKVTLIRSWLYIHACCPSLKLTTKTSKSLWTCRSVQCSQTRLYLNSWMILMIRRRNSLLRHQMISKHLLEVFCSQDSSTCTSKTSTSNLESSVLDLLTRCSPWCLKRWLKNTLGQTH